MSDLRKRSKTEVEFASREGSRCAEAAAPVEPAEALPWLTEGIVVKVVHAELQGGKYFNQKGVVTTLFGPFVAGVKLLKTGTVHT